jgi:hypothetical protein
MYDDDDGHFIGYSYFTQLDTRFTELRGASQVAIAPQGNFALVPLTTVVWAVNYGEFAPCEDPGPDADHPFLCRPYLSTTRTSSYQLHRVDLTNGAQGQWTTSATVVDAAVRWLSVSERGDEITLQTYHLAEDPNVGGEVCSLGATAFAPLPAGSATPGTAFKSVSVDGPRVCSGVFDGGGTISPSRRRPSKPGVRP